MFQRKKGLLSSIVQAGLFLSFTALLCACGEQREPVDATPAARVASAANPGDNTELPEVVVTASRGANGET